MLRSLFSGISGLRSHQTMLDVTGNNIANVNTTGFKASSVQFQDSLSQLLRNSMLPQQATGGQNPAQVGLGVQVAGISTNFAGGAPQPTGVPTDLMISGDGFFVVRSGGETLYTRNGGFTFDASGRLVGAGGALVQGWTARNGAIVPGQGIGDITLPVGALSPAAATTTARATGNLPSGAAVGETLVRDIKTYGADGSASTLRLTFTRSATGWDVTDGAGASTALTFTDGVQNGAGSIVSGGVTVDLSGVTGFADVSDIAIKEQNGKPAGTLSSYALTNDGSLVGTFSNGDTQVLARIALAGFVNPGGLEKVGSSQFRPSGNSGQAELGQPGTGGLGGIISGALEMSNVDLSQEFTNLIVAQRGFQANARIITTSDEVLQELTNLKR
ncbi:flagellar hook protein FlgE [Microbacterium paraoxydans]|jgi:flagellar hook protein FlgE|uniref:Flagellar hook protein FlgE n=3 Tax=Actinomycetes TaxID=1760 RepID=A0A1H1VGX4_9MICO|nr:MULTISPECIES: flagellar hook protein FlgE [Microbacterium]AVL96362.1 flagellar hook protein FlgE [Microbacterium sp. str. 'China']OIJ34088.1 flagellar hook protein [Microbacterium sp. LCT-H2]SDS83611.1 flagellar hook protein FlgE [Microbacterium paraoxydans]